MSVLIKGMKMPKNCDACPMFYECRLCALTDDHASSIEWKTEEKRMPNCPLIELPDHGDLIDRDALRKEWKFSESCNRCERDAYRCQYYEEMSPMDVCGMLDDAPVVIPAERSEDVSKPY